MKKPNSKELQQLVRNISNGHEPSFEKLFQLFSEKIYHISRKMRLNHEDAEGIVQEVFLKIWKFRDRLDPNLSINAYMIAMVRSLVIKKTKKEARFFAFQEYQIPFTNEASYYGADDDMIYTEFHNLSMEIIERLTPAQREIFKLKHFENLSNDEIALKLNLSKRTVENQIFRATKSFKERLAKLEIVSTSIWIIAFKTIFNAFIK
ncbi:RNA polymerase sigma factor [Echinicola sp. 20G]|uniref:RNA polymerase sigma factor n=1 Tax=Echinicola sp. 20G TaxID=2781961 RepID=UPI001910F9E5|nr:sigma-70 family RNA polymerase sigma factor [Echinicola sp. 20G]